MPLEGRSVLPASKQPAQVGLAALLQSSASPEPWSQAGLRGKIKGAEIGARGGEAALQHSQAEGASSC